MVLFYQCMLRCCKKSVDTANIVRDCDFSIANARYAPFQVATVRSTYTDTDSRSARRLESGVLQYRFCKRSKGIFILDKRANQAQDPLAAS
jgi:hypothetical protein